MLEYTVENGRITGLYFENKEALKYVKAIFRAQETPYFFILKADYTIEIDDGKIKLTQLDAAIYGFILNWRRAFKNGEVPKCSRYTYQTMRKLLKILNEKAYKTLDKKNKPWYN